MSALHFFGLGILILTLLPNILFTIERRRTPPPYHIALAAAGLLYSWLAMGATGVLLASLSGAGVTLFLTIGVASTQNKFGYRTLSGSEIRLFGASATWLSPLFALAALLLFFLGVAGTLYFRRLNDTAQNRPNLILYIAASSLTMFCYHLGS